LITLFSGFMITPVNDLGGLDLADGSGAPAAAPPDRGYGRFRRGGSPPDKPARAGRGGSVREIAEHARAVFAMLAEAVSIKEWFDVIVELPEEYHGLFPPRLA
jgi:hypothetical protein